MNETRMIILPHEYIPMFSAHIFPLEIRFFSIAMPSKHFTAGQRCSLINTGLLDVQPKSDVDRPAFLALSRDASRFLRLLFPRQGFSRFTSYYCASGRNYSLCEVDSFPRTQQHIFSTIHRFDVVVDEYLLDSLLFLHFLNEICQDHSIQSFQLFH